MACGKSTIGKKLSGKINFDFLDLDKYIETKKNKSISELFDLHGETYFREIEKQALHQTFKLKNTIVATGGGTPCFANNMQNINKFGTSIFINMPTKALLTRLQQAKHKRPLIQKIPNNELLNFIEKQINNRMPFYTKAHITISGLNFNLNEFVEKHFANLTGIMS